VFIGNGQHSDVRALIDEYRRHLKLRAVAQFNEEQVAVVNAIQGLGLRQIVGGSHHVPTRRNKAETTGAAVLLSRHHDYCRRHSDFVFHGGAQLHAHCMTALRIRSDFRDTSYNTALLSAS
jgi:hypothetical protein